jgi:hypothetical protein
MRGVEKIENAESLLRLRAILPVSAISGAEGNTGIRICFYERSILPGVEEGETNVSKGEAAEFFGIEPRRNGETILIVRRLLLFFLGGYRCTSGERGRRVRILISRRLTERVRTGGKSLERDGERGGRVDFEFLSALNHGG